MIVRDLLINFGAQLNKGDIKKADGQVKNFAQGARGVLNTIIGVQFLRMFKDAVFGITGLASAVIENQNVMDVAFGEGEKKVKSWAKTFGDAAGRSRYELEAMAGSMGGMLLPMMDKNQEKATEMSKGLAELAVDLASFYNLAKDTDALQKLRSGISGESEPMKILGVNMTVAALEAFRLKTGVTKAYKAMTLAEKTQLRYNFIMDQTAHVHGDAIKTADQLANASRGLVSKLSEVATTAGMKLVPMGGKIVNVLRQVVTWFSRVVDESHLVESALLVLGSVAAIVAVKLLAPFLPLIAGIALAVIAVDELWTLFAGGETAIGKFIDWIAGPGSAAAMVAYLKGVFKDFVNWAKNDGVLIWHQLKTSVMSFVQTSLPYLKSFYQSVGEGFAWLYSSVLSPFFGWLTDSAVPAVTGFVDTVWPPLSKFLAFMGDAVLWMWENAWKPFWGYVIDNVVPIISKVASVITSVLGPAFGFMIGYYREVYDQVVRVIDKIGEFSDAVIVAAKSAGEFLGFDMDSGTPAMAGAGGSRAVPGSSGKVNVPAPFTAVPSSYYRGGSNEIYQSINNNFAGDVSRRDADEIAKKSSDSVAKENRRTMAALKQKKAK